MLEEFGSSLFDKRRSVIVICTNGYINPSGYADLVSETALEANNLWSSLASSVGDSIRKEGSCVNLINDSAYSPFPMTVVTFPTKPGRIYLTDHENLIKEAVPKMHPLPKYLPGWVSRSNLNIIRHSAEELVELTNKKKWDKVYLPRVGCGSGKLRWPEVKLTIAPILDDRFTIIHQNLKSK